MSKEENKRNVFAMISNHITSLGPKDVSGKKTYILKNISSYFPHKC